MRSDGVVWKQVWKSGRRRRRRRCVRGWVWRGFSPSRGTGCDDGVASFVCCSSVHTPGRAPSQHHRFLRTRARTAPPSRRSGSVEEVVDGRRGGQDEGRHGLRGASASEHFGGGLDLRLGGVPGLPLVVDRPVAVGVDCVDGVLHAGRAGPLRRAAQRRQINNQTGESCANSTKKMVLTAGFAVAALAKPWTAKITT